MAAVNAYWCRLDVSERDTHRQPFACWLMVSRSPINLRVVIRATSSKLTSTRQYGTPWQQHDDGEGAEDGVGGAAFAPADLGGAELSRSRATPEKWEPGWLRLAYKATCRRELAQLAVKHLAPVLSQCQP
jgi:hypothetical protein